MLFRAIWATRRRVRTPSLTHQPIFSARLQTDFASLCRTLDQNTSIRSIADESGVSEAMIVKVSKKIGFKGFRDLRAAIAEYNRYPSRKCIKSYRRAILPQSLSRRSFGRRLKPLRKRSPFLIPKPCNVLRTSCTEQGKGIFTAWEVLLKSLSTLRINFSGLAFERRFTMTPTWC